MYDRKDERNVNLIK